MRNHSHSVEGCDVSAIKVDSNRSRRNPSAQIDEAARQLKRVGQVVEPPLLDNDNNVICGGAIVLAARKLGWAQIPVLRIGNMSSAELRLYAINAHALAEMGSYDDALLAAELRELDRLLEEDVFEALAFEEGEVTRLLGLANKIDAGNLEASADTDCPVVTRPGDIWSIGNMHRMLCASSLESSSYPLLMDGKLAQFGLADPPYNIPKSNISSNPEKKDFAFAHGEMSPNEFTRFLTTVMREMRAYSEEGSLHAIFSSYHFLLELLRAGVVVFDRPKAMCTWIKDQPGQGLLFRSQTEYIAYFQNGNGAYRNNVKGGKHGRNRSTAWHYDGMVSATSEQAELLKQHLTPKPVDLLQDAILDVTTKGGIVLDPFGGIGSTMVAAHAAERKAYLIEIEPKFVDVAIRRMSTVYGLDAVRLPDGKSFSELTDEVERSIGDSA